jgi:hypothetical protein
MITGLGTCWAEDLILIHSRFPDLVEKWVSIALFRDCCELVHIKVATETSHTTSV